MDQKNNKEWPQKIEVITQKRSDQQFFKSRVGMSALSDTRTAFLEIIKVKDDHLLKSLIGWVVFSSPVSMWHK